MENYVSLMRWQNMSMRARTGAARRKPKQLLDMETADTLELIDEVIKYMNESSELLGEFARKYTELRSAMGE